MRCSRPSLPMSVFDRKIALVPVIDCFAYPWPIKGFCVRGVQDNARKLNLQLYVDMSGKMFQDYGAASSTSTVIIIDRAGVVRYVMPGKIPDENVGSVVELASKLFFRTLSLLAQRKVCKRKGTPGVSRPDQGRDSLAGHISQGVVMNSHIRALRQHNDRILDNAPGLAAPRWGLKPKTQN